MRATTLAFLLVFVPAATAGPVAPFFVAHGTLETSSAVCGAPASPTPATIVARGASGTWEVATEATPLGCAMVVPPLCFGEGTLDEGIVLTDCGAPGFSGMLGPFDRPAPGIVEGRWGRVVYETPLGQVSGDVSLYDI